MQSSRVSRKSVVVRESTSPETDIAQSAHDAMDQRPDAPHSAAPIDGARSRGEAAAARRATRRERQRLGAELHDGVAQELAGIAMLAAGIEREMQRGRKMPVARFTELRRLLEQAQEHCRMLSHNRMESAITGRALGRELRALAARETAVAGIECRYIGPLRPRRVPPDRISHNLYRVAQEAVGNAVRHSGATQITLQLELDAGVATLSVRDDGAGLGRALRKVDDGIGIRTMRYRVHALGGTLAIHDVRPSGLEVLARVPLPSRRR